MVTITGTNLTGTSSVTFGGALGTIDSITATTVTVSTPAGAAGAVAVILTTPNGSVTAPQAFTYIAPTTAAPTLYGISPSSGPPSGGESVFLGGINLCNPITVTFNGVVATVTSVNSDCGGVYVTEPAGSGTDVPVVITTAGGTSTSPIPFTYIEAGYWEASGDGGVFSYGGAQFYGSVPGALQPGQKLNSPIVAMADTPDHGGYWLFAADGGVFAFGDAPFLGSVPGVLGPQGRTLNAPIVTAEATPDGHGYRMFAADGGVFDFGDAQFVGSLPGVPETPTAPIAAAASTPIGQGYWLAGQDGNIYHFGNVPFSESGLGAFYGRVVAMASTPDGDGYYLFLQSGAVAHFGDATAGLGGATSGNIVFGQATSTGKGYWEFATNGAVSSFGDAPTLGQPNFALNAPVVAAIAFGETTS